MKLLSHVEEKLGDTDFMENIGGSAYPPRSFWGALIWDNIVKDIDSFLNMQLRKYGKDIIERKVKVSRASKKKKIILSGKLRNVSLKRRRTIVNKIYLESVFQQSFISNTKISQAWHYVEDTNSTPPGKKTWDILALFAGYNSYGNFEKVNKLTNIVWEEESDAKWLYWSYHRRRTVIAALIIDLGLEPYFFNNEICKESTLEYEHISDFCILLSTFWEDLLSERNLLPDSFFNAAISGLVTIYKNSQIFRKHLETKNCIGSLTAKFLRVSELNHDAEVKPS